MPSMSFRLARMARLMLYSYMAERLADEEL